MPRDRLEVSETSRKTKNIGFCSPFMELAELEPAASWVRSNNSAARSSQGQLMAKADSVISATPPDIYG
jgi:RNA polymerase sigma-70 factor, ECF subfamily